MTTWFVVFFGLDGTYLYRLTSSAPLSYSNHQFLFPTEGSPVDFSAAL